MATRIPYHLRYALREAKQADRLEALDELAQLVAHSPIRMAYEVRALLLPYQQHRDEKFRQRVVDLLIEIEELIRESRLQADARKEAGVRRRGDSLIIRDKAQCPNCGSVYFEFSEGFYRCTHCHTAYRSKLAAHKATQARAASRQRVGFSPIGILPLIFLCATIVTPYLKYRIDRATQEAYEYALTPLPEPTLMGSGPILEVFDSVGQEAVTAYFDSLSPLSANHPRDIHFTPSTRGELLHSREFANFALRMTVLPNTGGEENRTWALQLLFRMDSADSYQEILIQRDAQQTTLSVDSHLAARRDTLLAPQVLPAGMIETGEATPIHVLIFEQRGLLLIDGQRFTFELGEPATVQPGQAMITAEFENPASNTYSLSVMNIDLWILPED